MTVPASATRSRTVYALIAGWLAVTTAVHIWINAVLYPTAIYWISYYSPNYDHGFVRRGLGGELIAMFPAEHYFTVAHTIVWASSLIWLGALAVLMYVIVTTGAGSARNIMLALLIPVLPFAVSYGLYSPHPELFAMSALIAFSIALTRVRTPRGRLLWSAGYGVMIAVLTFAHEGIPMALSLGAVLAIVVLAGDAPAGARRVCSALAVLPGVIALIVVTLFGRRDVAHLLCENVPHRMLENPYAIMHSPELVLQYMLGRIESQSDYHDWVCKNAGTHDAGPVDGMKMVLEFGFVPLLNSFIAGLLFFAITVWAIGYLSGVPFSEFRRELRGKRLLPLLSALMVLPLFLAGVDWTRWWVLITANIAIVYLLYVIGRPEVHRPPARRAVPVLVILVVVLAVIPTGAALHVGGPNFF